MTRANLHRIGEILFGIACFALSGLGRMALYKNDHVQARHLFEESLALDRASSRKHNITLDLCNLVVLQLAARRRPVERIAASAWQAGREITTGSRQARRELVTGTAVVSSNTPSRHPSPCNS